MKNVWLMLTLFYNFQRICGQTSFGCPTGWELFNNRCYKFEKDDRLIYEEADSACWVQGAALLSINDYQEHNFVSNWLIKHDSLHPTTWYTSGAFYDGILTWDDLGIIDTSDQAYWVTGFAPQGDANFMETNIIRIAYVLGGYNFDGFGWSVISPSIPSAYICEVDRKATWDWGIQQRGFGYGVGIVDINDVKVGPVIDTSPKSVIVFGTAPSIYIECRGKGNPFPDFTWQRGDKKIESVNSLTDSRYTISGGRFTIENPENSRDNANYQCTAENEFGKVLSDPAEIRFGNLGYFSNVKPQDVQANKFEGTRILCVAPAFNPAVRYEWFQWSTEEFIFEEHPYIFISSSGYLYFSEVQPTDNRKYFCVVTLTTSSYEASNSQPPSRTSMGVYLIVTGTEHGFFEPVIYTHTFPSPALRGAQIRLECVAYGSLPLKYTWSRLDGREFEKGTRIFDHNRVLTIDNAQIEAEGIYQCHVDGKGGSSTKNISLSIESKPYFMVGIGNMLVDPGQTIQWRCKAVARPASTYSWYKNGKILENIPGHLEVHRNYLLIKNVDKDTDEGMYQCSATNIHGTTFSTGQLKIMYITPNFDRYPIHPLTQIPYGGNYTIACKVEAAPIPNVVWLKNGAQMGIMPGDLTGHVSMSMENDLIFNMIEYSDQGTYTCKASNVLGEATNSTRVEVITGIIIQTGPIDTPVQVNKTAFLKCQASYDYTKYDLTYVWKFNGYVLNFDMSSHFIPSNQDGLDGLYIRNAQFTLTGRYTCEARTTLHVASRTATLTVYGPPGAVAGAYVRQSSTTSNSVQLIWTVTSDMNHGNPISRYNIEAEIEHYPDEWNIVKTDTREDEAVSEAVQVGLRPEQRLTKVEDLLPNIGYRFRVRAINDLGTAQEASKPSVQVKTTATAPVRPPDNVGGLKDEDASFGKVGTLTIVWDPLDKSEYSGPGVGYFVYFKKEGDPKDWTKANVTGAGSSNYTHLVGQPNYYLPYTVKVGAYNDFGAGPNSTETTVMSAEDMPVAQVLMGDCDNYNGSAFSMSWTPVEDTRETMKGRLKGYRVRYWHIDDPDAIIYRDLYGQQDSTVIIGVSDNANYWSSVQVMNFAGVGPIGEIRLAETFHLPPRDYPRHVKVFSHSRHSVRVTWQGVSTRFDEETLAGYILRVWKIQEDIRTATDTSVDKVMEAIIDNLQVKTVYVLRVLGFSIGGDGALSPHVYFTVEGGNVPFDPTTTQFCFDDRVCDDSGTSLRITLFNIVLIYLLSLCLF